MSVLDELRAMFDIRSRYSGGVIVHRIEKFEAAHPGLVELACCFCGRPVTDRSKVRASGFICPACAKEENHD